MKIFNAYQTRNLDDFTQKEQGISSYQLMERASEKCVFWIKDNFKKETTFVVFCGLGNNGGDGLAIARMLLASNYKVITYVVKYSSEQKPDFKKNLDVLNDVECIRTIISEKHIPPVENNAVVIDCILGAGLNKPVEGVCKSLIEKLNSLPNTKIAIDVPSGISYNPSLYNRESAFKSDYTLTFEYPKLTFLLPEYSENIGKWIVLPIGLSKTIIKNTETPYYYITKEMVSNKLQKRAKFSHKGSFGHAEIIGGSMGKIGAVSLASKACLRIGSGLVTAYTPPFGMNILQTTLPEAMWSGNKQSDTFLEGNYISTHKTVGIGVGMGTHPKTRLFLNLVIKGTKTPMVIDADAINIISKNKEMLNALPENSILTPHPKEFKRLVGDFESESDKLEKLKEFSTQHQCIVVLKGAHTVIANTNGDLFFNATGNPGMATAGSGDVLTGIITGLLAQNYTPLDAAIVGVYLHGLSGDIAMKKKGMQTIIASDLINYIGKAYVKTNAKKAIV